MALGRKLVWDAIGTREYETGTKDVVLFVQNSSGAYRNGVAWSGCTGVSENPSGAESSKLYADDIAYLNLVSAEEFAATITAYMYPPEFEECNGVASIAKGVSIGQQSRRPFGLAYTTTIGNDTDSTDYGYKIHLVYNGTAAVSNNEYKSINNDPDAIEFSFDVSTTPVKIDGYKPTATLVINSTVTDAKKLKEFEEILYGKDPELLKESPADWSTNWKNYVEKKDGEYALIDAESAPEFTTGKYYAPGVESRLMLPDEVAAFFAEG